MSREAYIRASLAVAVMQLFPPRLRGALLSDATLRDEYGISTDAVVSFGGDVAEFQRSALFSAVTRLLQAGAAHVTIQDNRGEEWRVEFVADEPVPKITFAQATRRFFAVQPILLSSDRELRLKVLQYEADRVNLPAQAFEKWKLTLESRPPDDDEMGLIQDDLNNTPIAAQNAILANLVSPTISLDVLVPRSEEYYVRLVGRPGDEQALENFVESVASLHMEGLVKWRSFEGYQLALLLASQPSLSSALDAVGIKTGELIKVYEWLTAIGDPISRTAAIEAGLFRAQREPELKDSLQRLIEITVSGNGESQLNPYKLLSSLIIGVYGEIARTRVLASRPPYWCRLAAIAQSALIARCVSVCKMDATAFAEWVSAVRGHIFQLQCFVDLRMEPRWLPEFILADQLQHELGGRIFAAANAQASFVTEAGWGRLLLDDIEGSLKTQLHIARIALPGPLEGGIKAQLEIPANQLDKMQSDLLQPQVSLASFSRLVNGAFLFDISNDIADLAADAIARADYQIECGDDQAHLGRYLRGLAFVAATKRSHKLADTLFALLRKYRQSQSEELSVEDAFQVAMVASASRAELSEWCRCVGGSMIDLAFQPLDPDEARRLYSQVVLLCHLVPELWGTCGQAEAALRSVLKI